MWKKVRKTKGPTRVVNIKKESADVYIGRPMYWGNPFMIGRDGTREEVVAKFREMAYDKVLVDKKFRKRLKFLKGKKLGCYCAPLACHGDILAELAEKVYSGEVNVED